MKNLILFPFFLFSVIVFGQQAEVLNKEKYPRSILEKNIYTRNDSIKMTVRKNINYSILESKKGCNILQYNNLTPSEIQINANRAATNNFRYNTTLSGIYTSSRGEVRVLPRGQNVR